MIQSNAEFELVNSNSSHRSLWKSFQSRQFMCLIVFSVILVLIVIILIINMKVSATREPSIKFEYKKWKQDGITIAGGHGEGNQSDQLANPEGIFIDKYQTIYIADCQNHRIVQWKYNSKSGQIIAGGNEQGNQTNQLKHPTDVFVEKENFSFLVCDYGNKRVVRWFFQNQTTQQILLINIQCWSLVIDKQGYIYVSDHENNEVRRWKDGDQQRILVAGGNGRGIGLNQLYLPTYISIDSDYSIYVSDHHNHRVMKWKKDAKEGIVVAGRSGEKGSVNQLSYPRGITTDSFGGIYVADCDNHRIMRWYEGNTSGEIIIDGNGQQKQSNQLGHPTDLSFDNEGNLYVVDWRNHRIQKYEILF